MSNVQDEIRAKVDAFAAELTLLVRAAALEAVRASLGETIAPAAAPAAPAPSAAQAASRSRARPPSRSRSRSSSRKAAPAKPVAAAAPAAAAPAAPARAAASAARKKGQKRDPADLAKLVERLFDYIKANPGRRIEHIKAALGVPTSELTLPIRKLAAAHRITSKGEKRATTYSPR